MAKATADSLNDLHGKLAEVLLSALEGDEVSPAVLAQARQFLKDNNIEAEMVKNKNLQRLATVTQLPFAGPPDLPNEAVNGN
jgi:hypothetical protein